MVVAGSKLHEHLYLMDLVPFINSNIEQQMGDDSVLADKAGQAFWMVV
jgi:hypothetical protein